MMLLYRQEPLKSQHIQAKTPEEVHLNFYPYKANTNIARLEVSRQGQCNHDYRPQYVQESLQKLGDGEFYKKLAGQVF